MPAAARPLGGARAGGAGAAAPGRTTGEQTPAVRTIAVSAPYTDPDASEFDGFHCAGLASTPSCGVRFVGTSTWAGGTITGGEHYELAGGPTIDGKLTYEGPAYVTGAVQGCGSGTFIIDNYDGYIDLAKDDPTNNFEGGVGGSAPGFNYWKVRAGSGTGGLAGLVSGGGVNHWRFYNAGGAGLGGPEGIGLFTGTITCRPMLDAAATAPSPPAPSAPAVVARGGYVNDLPCIPLGAGTGADGSVDLVCSGGSIWDGDFLGRTVIYMRQTIDSASHVTGTYEEFFVGTYAGDQSRGGIHTKGYFVVDEKNSFYARAEIVGATCDWAGSSGSMVADGFVVNGGYVVTWNRPPASAASDPACNPVDWVPGATS
jgi:hypothetical protein